MTHNGYTLTCDVPREHYQSINSFTAKAKTERTAIEHARAKGWFVGVVRITAGGFPKSRVESVRRILCPACKWIVGAP